jgi:hypothetical protein
MNDKPKKKKNKNKSNDDLLKVKTDKKVSFKNNDLNNSSRTDNENIQNKIESTRKRKHTKVSKKSKENNINNNVIEDTLSEKQKKVKFSKIDIIDVESWKKLNLKLTAEENLDELLKLTEGKKGKDKNISCNCIIF